MEEAEGVRGRREKKPACPHKLEAQGRRCRPREPLARSPLTRRSPPAPAAPQPRSSELARQRCPREPRPAGSRGSSARPSRRRCPAAASEGPGDSSAGPGPPSQPPDRTALRTAVPAASPPAPPPPHSHGRQQHLHRGSARASSVQRGRGELPPAPCQLRCPAAGAGCGERLRPPGRAPAAAAGSRRRCRFRVPARGRARRGRAALRRRGSSSGGARPARGALRRRRRPGSGTGCGHGPMGMGLPRPTAVRDRRLSRRCLCRKKRALRVGAAPRCAPPAPQESRSSRQGRGAAPGAALAELRSARLGVSSASVGTHCALSQGNK